MIFNSDSLSCPFPIELVSLVIDQIDHLQSLFSIAVAFPNCLPLVLKRCASLFFLIGRSESIGYISKRSQYHSCNVWFNNTLKQIIIQFYVLLAAKNIPFLIFPNLKCVDERLCKSIIIKNNIFLPFLTAEQSEYLHTHFFESRKLELDVRLFPSFINFTDKLHERVTLMDLRLLPQKIPSFEISHRSQENNIVSLKMELYSVFHNTQHIHYLARNLHVLNIDIYDRSGSSHIHSICKLLFGNYLPVFILFISGVNIRWDFFDSVIIKHAYLHVRFSEKINMFVGPTKKNSYLESLVFVHDGEASSHYMSNFISSFPALKNLRIVNDNSLTWESFSTLLHKLPQLQHLELDNCAFCNEDQRNIDKNIVVTYNRPRKYAKHNEIIMYHDFFKDCFCISDLHRAMLYIDN